MKAIYENEKAEQAFRAWQARNTGILNTLWVVSVERQNEMSFDRFCLAVYTGNIKTSLCS